MIGHVLKGNGKKGEESQANLIPFNLELELKFKITGSHIPVQKSSFLTLNVKKT